MTLPNPINVDSPVSVPPQGHESSELGAALTFLLEGGVVALPTDTLFGLAADVTNERALERIFDIKGRPPEMALPVLVANWHQVRDVARVESTAARKLASKFWPGSLTLVLPRQPNLLTLVTGGRESVAVRMPDHWVPLWLSSQLGRPITGTSANRSGQPDLKTSKEVNDVLGDAVDTVIAAGPAPLGLQSTIVDLTGPIPVLLRDGAIPFAQVSQAWEELAGLQAETKGTGG